MEFGLFFNGYMPGPAAHNSELEHLMLMRELGYYEKPEHEFVRRCVTEAGAFSESVLESVFSISCPRNEFREFRKRLTVLCDPFSEATPS